MPIYQACAVTTACIQVRQTGSQWGHAQALQLQREGQAAETVLQLTSSCCSLRATMLSCWAPACPSALLLSTSCSSPAAACSLADSAATWADSAAASGQRTGSRSAFKVSLQYSRCPAGVPVKAPQATPSAQLTVWQ